MSNIAYHELTSENHERTRRRSSITFIPKSGYKRTLLFLCLIVGTAIIFAYKRQPMYNYEDVAIKSLSWNDEFNNTFNEKDSIIPHWTWICENEQCKRTIATENTTLQSLNTCNMICMTMPLWPMPTGSVKLSKTLVPVNADGFTLQILKTSSKEVTEYLRAAFELFKSDIRNIVSDTGCNYEDSAKYVSVRVAVSGSGDPRMNLNTTEHYKLVLNQEGSMLVAYIWAESFCGARHGFETLLQLIWFDPYTESLMTVAAASIEDAPKFHYRSLLLDTSRNYFPVKDILRTIDAMAATKLNTFHWHATDSQSFPLKLNSVPQFAMYGAYGRNAVYTTDDMKTIVHRARLRGIRVLIEVDAPAHVGSGWSWGSSAGLGDLAYCIDAHPWKGICGEPPCGQLNPKNDHVFELLEKIYTEIIELTGVDDVFHLGGDEVNDACWRTNIKGMDVMKARLEFREKAKDALQRANKGKLPEMTILWSSRLTQMPYLTQLKNYTIQLWGGSTWADIRAIPNAGFRSIISHVDAWYLDCGFGSWVDASDGSCGPYRKWKEVYSHRPWSRAANWNIEGGEACMWSEQLGPEGLDARLWPRAAAFAERLWSDPDGIKKNLFVRMDIHRKRFVERGVGAEPIWPRWCTDNPYECL